MYHTLTSYNRPLLFLETYFLKDSQQTTDVPVQVLLHHILVRAGSIPLPYEMHNWQEIEYCKYISEHTALENMRLVEAALTDWESSNRNSQDEHDEVTACIRIAREVMERERRKAVAELEQ